MTETSRYPLSHRTDQTAAAGDQSDEIELGRTLQTIWLGKRVFGLTIPIGLAIAVLLMWLLPIKYSAEMVVTPGVSLASKSSDTAGSSSSILSFLGTRGAEETVTPFMQFQELLRSPEVAKRLDEKHQLLRILFAGRWDAEKNTWKEPEGALATVKNWIRDGLNTPAPESPNYQTLANQLSQIVTVTQKARSSVWTITVVYKDPVLARDLLLWLRDEADAIVRDMATQRTRSNIEYLVSTLPSVTVNEQRTALTNLLVQQELNMMMLHSSSSYSAEILEAPEIPLTRTSPNPVLVLSACLVAAIVAGAGWAAFHDRRLPTKV